MNQPRPRPGAATDAPPSEAATRQARLIAGVIGGVFLIMVIGFVSMVFFIQEEARLNAIGPIAASPGAEHGGLVFRGTANIWDVRGRMTLNNDRQVRFAFDLVGPTAHPAPPNLPFNLALDMPDSDMLPLPLSRARTGPGSYVATAMLPEPGRWRLRIEFEEITGVFEFDVDH